MDPRVQRTETLYWALAQPTSLLKTRLLATPVHRAATRTRPTRPKAPDLNVAWWGVLLTHHGLLPSCFNIDILGVRRGRPPKSKERPGVASSGFSGLGRLRAATMHP